MRRGSSGGKVRTEGMKVRMDGKEEEGVRRERKRIRGICLERVRGGLV